MEISTHENGFKFKFCGYEKKNEKEQKEMVELGENASFKTEALMQNTSYSYKIIDYGSVNIKWLGQDGLLRQRTVLYNPDDQNLEIYDTQKVLIPQAALENTIVSFFKQLDRFLTVCLPFEDREELIIYDQAREQVLWKKLFGPKELSNSNM